MQLWLHCLGSLTAIHSWDLVIETSHMSAWHMRCQQPKQPAELAGWVTGKCDLNDSQSVNVPTAVYKPETSQIEWKRLFRLEVKPLPDPRKGVHLPFFQIHRFTIRTENLLKLWNWSRNQFERKSTTICSVGSKSCQVVLLQFLNISNIMCKCWSMPRDLFCSRDVHKTDTFFSVWYYMQFSFTHKVTDMLSSIKTTASNKKLFYDDIVISHSHHFLWSVDRNWIKTWHKASLRSLPLHFSALALI